jgi:GNAT superfamily N-acetyltransferase
MTRPHLRLDWDEPPTARPLPPDVTVRRVGPADAAAVGEVLWLADQGMRDREWADEREALAEAAETFEGQWGELCWPSSLIASAAGRAVGVALVVFDAAHAGLPLLAFVATVPEWQRHGIASGLITRALPGLQEAGWNELHLAVEDGNPARGVYERLGFVLVP